MTLTITPTFTANWNSNAPAGATACINSAIAFLTSNYKASITINITFDFGSTSGFNNALAHSTFFTVPLVSYTTIRSALTSLAQTANATTAVSNDFPVTDPTSGTNATVTDALSRLYGIQSGASPGNTVLMSNGVSWTTNNSGGVGAGTYDMQNIALHEITEIMGRFRNGASNTWYPLDLMAFSGVGTRTWNTTGGYFSIDAGTTNLSTPNAFSTTAQTDPGDWSGAAADACNANGTISTLLPFSSYDQVLMDALGWQFGTTFVPPAATHSWLGRF